MHEGRLPLSLIQLMKEGPGQRSASPLLRHIKNHQIPVTAHQRFGTNIDKPFAITEPVTGVKFNVTGKEREKYFILSADKIKSYYEERKKTMQKILGQGRGR